MTFRLYETESGGSPIWSETQMATTAGGLFTVMLGSIRHSVPLWILHHRCGFRWKLKVAVNFLRDTN
ncbi:hypothetical protein J7M00_03030 [bacterium]|nr:hypothetical protein [bacterium]